MKDKRISIVDALHIIRNDIQTLETKIEKRINDDIEYKSITSFINFLEDIIRYKWLKAFPSTYLKCYVTDDSYNTLNGAGYSWIMTIINRGNFNELINLSKCADSDVYKLINSENISKEEASSRIIERRKQLALEIYINNNIADWVITHLSIS